MDIVEAYSKAEKALWQVQEICVVGGNDLAEEISFNAYVRMTRNMVVCFRLNFRQKQGCRISPSTWTEWSFKQKFGRRIEESR